MRRAGVARAAAGAPRSRLVAGSDVLDWLLAECRRPTLFGFDSQSSRRLSPIAATICPAESELPGRRQGLWHYVEAVSDYDPHLAAASFLDQVPTAATSISAPPTAAVAATFSMPAAGGCDKAELRSSAGAERLQRLSISSAPRRSPSRASPACACFIASTASSPSGRWTRLPGQGIAVVEIYTRILPFGGRAAEGEAEVASATLNRALAALGSQPARRASGARRPPDRRPDERGLACAVAHARSGAWAPTGLTPEIAQTEGWTFGVL